MNNFCVILIVIIFALNGIHCLNTCASDWIAYEDKKCYKVLDIKRTQEEGVQKCTETSSTLLNIETKEEQEFIANFLSKYSECYDKAWIGLKYTNTSFQWLNGKDVQYTNWADDAIIDGSLTCVEIEIFKSRSYGKWIDDTCKKTELIVCEKKQEWDISAVIDVLQNMSAELAALKNTIPIPIGYLYIQLSNQLKPEELWPWMGWKEVTQEYSGLFFRAEGGQSLPFGQIQQQNYSSITEVYTNHYYGYYTSPYQSTEGPIENVGTTPIVEGAWSADIAHNDDSSNHMKSMYVYMTKGENRPINTAIKLWKRIN